MTTVFKLLKNKKLLIVLLVLVLSVESLWAVGFIRKNNKTINFSPAKLLPKKDMGRLSLTPGRIETKSGEQFSLGVIVDPKNYQINGVDAVIQYDPNVLTVVDADNQKPQVQVAQGDLFPTLLINSVDPLEGIITLTASRLSKDTPAINTSGSLANITFISQISGTTQVRILFDPNTSSTSNIMQADTSNNILTDVDHATIQITQ